MLQWEDIKFYKDKFFRTCIDFYFCEGKTLCEHQPWKPWSTYVLIPARSHLHITSVEEVKVPTYLGFGEEIRVVVQGTLPPWVMKPIDVTNIVRKNETRREDVLKLDRQLSYSNQTHGKPWLTPALRPTFLKMVHPDMNRHTGHKPK